MTGLFDEIIVLVTKKDVIAAQAERLGETDQSILQGAVLSATTVVAGMARVSADRDGSTRLQSALAALARSGIGSDAKTVNDDELQQQGDDLIDWLLDHRAEEIVGHISKQAELSRDSATAVLSTTAARIGAYLALYRNGPPVVADLPARLADEEAGLITAGWGPWIERTLPRRSVDQPTDVLRPKGASPLLPDRQRLEAEQRAAEKLEAKQSAPLRPVPSKSRRLPGWLVVAVVLLLIAAVVGALALWQRADESGAEGREAAGEAEGGGAESAATSAPDQTTSTATVAPGSSATTGSAAGTGSADDTVSSAPTSTTEIEPIPEVVEYSIALVDPQNRSEASGTLDLRLDTVAGEICYAFDVEGMQNPYAAHIHVGPNGANGGITVDFGTDLSESSADCVASEPADLVAAVTKSSQRYVELHDPSGAFSLRGQLTDPEPGESGQVDEIDIDDGAYLAVSGGSIILRGDVPDQGTLDSFLASQPEGDSDGDPDGAITVINELQIVEGAPPPSGLVLIEDSILFAIDSTELTDADISVLADIADVLKARPAWSVNLVGHTDSSGPVLHNFELSLQRAGAVRQALVDLGVPAAAVTIQGNGPFSPIAENDTDDGRAENRRIELRVETKS